MSNPAPDSGLRIGRYLDKRWDWDAFPANAGYPELERAQMRYVGAGGSPKIRRPQHAAAGRVHLQLDLSRAGPQSVDPPS